MIGEDADFRALERKFFTALEEGDSSAIAECYAPEMRVWNNVQPAEMSGSQHIAGLESHFFDSILDRKYVDACTDRIDDGFVRQHVLIGTQNGEPIRMPICTICRVRNGKLVRIEEYLTFAPPMPAPS